MRTAACALIALTIAWTALADDPASRRAAAETYVQSPGQQAAIEQMLSADQMLALMRAQIPEATDEQLQGIAKIAGEELGSLRAPMETAMIEAAVETLTLEEIEALDAFYRTPVGASVMSKMPVFMQTAMVRIAPEMQAAQMRILERAAAEVPGLE